MKTDIYGHLAVTVVDGTTLTGIWAADGSLNVFDATSSSGYVGLMHPCGAINCTSVTGTTLVGRQNANGSLNIVNDSAQTGLIHPCGAMNITNFTINLAANLLNAYGPYGMSIDFMDQSIAINDNVTPANNFSSKGNISGSSFIGPAAKLTYTAPSPKQTEQADGYRRYQAHNLYLNSATPANQSITVQSGASYTLTLTGSVSITLSGAATGTVTAGSTVFTAATGTLTCGSTSGSGTVHLRLTLSNTDYIATTSAAKYAPPYRYSGGVCQGIDIEPQATNINYPSSTFASGYGASNATPASASVLLPDGTTGGSVITDTLSLANHFIYPTSLSSGVPLATNHAITVEAKAGTSRYLIVNLQGTANNWISAVFDLLNSTATVASQTGTGSSSGTIVSTAQSSRSDGWVTCTLVGQVGTSCTPSIGMANAASGNTFNSIGMVVYTGVLSTFYVNHFQVEAGTFATSFIRTYSAAVVRAQDTIGGLISAIGFNTSEFTLFAEGTYRANPSNYPAILELRDAGSANRAEIFINPASNVKQYAMTASVAQVDMASGLTATMGTSFRAAARFKASDFAISANGAAAATQASGTIPTGLTDFCLYGSGRAPMSIKRIAVIARGLSDAELPTIGA